MALLDKVTGYQSARQRLSWGTVRIISSWRLFIAEIALRLALASTPTERGAIGYRLAVLLTRRYDPRYGDGLIPESSEAVQQITVFLKQQYGVV